MVTDEDTIAKNFWEKQVQRLFSKKIKIRFYDNSRTTIVPDTIERNRMGKGKGESVNGSTC